MMKTKTTKATLLALALGIFTHSNAFAQESELQWSFTQDNASKTAGLSYAVPETDNVRVYATCGGPVPKGTSSFIIDAAYGNLQPGSPTRVRFSGNGKEYEVQGVVEKPQSSEGLHGVKLSVANNDPVWAAFDSNASLSYQVPGFAAQQLPLVGGQTAIRNFVEACRFLANGGQQTATNSGGNSGSRITEREAFNAAKDLNEREAWEAFLRVYPTGFFAELARRYLARDNGNQGNTQQGNNQQNNTPSKPPVQANLPYVNPGMDSTPWYNFNYEQDEGNASSYAAGVRARGVEFLAWCGSNRRLNFVVREIQQNIYPAFDQRVRQASDSGRPATMTLANGSRASFPMQYYELNGEVGLEREVSPNDPLVTRLLKDNSFILENGPFGATFQLKNSRRAICSVLNRCGAAVTACQPRKVVRTPNRTNSNKGNCRSRSVYIPGRGCVLRKYVNKGSSGSSNGCRNGKIRFEGQCLHRSELRSYCGPGYVPRGSRCVSTADTGRRLQQGVYVTEAFCQRQGLIKEGNYCVEDD